MFTVETIIKSLNDYDHTQEIKKILQNGMSQDFNYLSNNNENIKIDKIIEIINKKKIITFYNEFENINFLLTIISYEDSIIIKIEPTKPFKTKVIENKVIIDRGYYIRLILKLCKRFVIYSIFMKEQ